MVLREKGQDLARLWGPKVVRYQETIVFFYILILIG